MAVLTNFLKLLKPEKNDYVDVDKHISENYDKIDSKMQELSTSNNGKLDKGAVSSEYDTAKKIEDKIKAAQGTADNKLNKGGYNDTAQTLKNEIDGKVSKNGDKINGRLSIVSDNNNIVVTNKSNTSSYAFGLLGDGQNAGIYDLKNNNKLAMFNDGTVIMDAKNLQTNSKEVITAINEIIPSKEDQLFSNHYFHKIFHNNGDYVVYEHLFESHSNVSKNPTYKEIRPANGNTNGVKYNIIRLYHNGIKQSENNNDGSYIEYYYYNQKNIGNRTILWDNTSMSLQNNIILNDRWDNYEYIVFEMCNYLNTGTSVDYEHKIFITSLLRTNNTATSDNSENDYNLEFFGGSFGFGTLYFRDDKRTVYVDKPIEEYTPPIVSRVRAIYGINKKSGVI